VPRDEGWLRHLRDTIKSPHSQVSAIELLTEGNNHG